MNLVRVFSKSVPKRHEQILLDEDKMRDGVQERFSGREFKIFHGSQISVLSAKSHNIGKKYSSILRLIRHINIARIATQEKLV